MAPQEEKRGNIKLRDARQMARNSYRSSSIRLSLRIQRKWTLGSFVCECNAYIFM